MDTICPTSGTGPLLTGGSVHDQSPRPHGVRRASAPGILVGKGKARCDWNRRWRYHGRWTGDCVGLWPQSDKDHRKRKTPTTTVPNIRRMAKRGPTNNKTAARRSRRVQAPCIARTRRTLQNRQGNRGPHTNHLLLLPPHWGVHNQGQPGKRNETKQTVQFKYEDITFFKKNAAGQLRCLLREAPASLIAAADGATMKLDNQKNWWKGVWVYQETNGKEYLCPVRALGRRFLHIRTHGGSAKTLLSLPFGIRKQKRAEHISRALKSAATELQYPTNKGIPIPRINTHSLRSGGANALALAGYSDTQIQKMGR